MTATGQPDTDELLDRAGRGDAGARQALLKRHRARLRRMVAVRLDGRVAVRVDPSDLVQETLAEAAARLADYLSNEVESLWTIMVAVGNVLAGVPTRRAVARPATGGRQEAPWRPSPGYGRRRAARRY